MTCSYYNTGNYATIEDRTTDDKQINYKVRGPRIIISAGIFGVRTKNVCWGNQGILGLGNRYDNIDPSFYYYAYTNTKCVEREQKKWLLRLD